MYCCAFMCQAEDGKRDADKWLECRRVLFRSVVLAALGVQMFIVCPLLLIVLARRSPIAFFRDTQEASVMAFSTASSNATLPTSLRVADTERSDERRVGQVCVSTCRSRGSMNH